MDTKHRISTSRKKAFLSRSGAAKRVLPGRGLTAGELKERLRDRRHSERRFAGGFKKGWLFLAAAVAVFAISFCGIRLFFSCSTGGHTSGPKMNALDFTSDLRRRLTRQYCRRHYGLDTWKLKEPKMVVIHYTGGNSLGWARRYFKPDIIPASNPYTSQFGKVNLSAHFLVDRDGTVYRVIPENMIARHVIGYNHVAFGIENVASGADALTETQLVANVLLVRYLKKKYPGIRYLIGHHEYMRRDLPHFRLYRELGWYQPMRKPDPGPRFMRRLRKRLFSEYEMSFLP